MLIELKAEKVNVEGQDRLVIGFIPTVETISIKVDGILSVFNHEKFDDKCQVMAIGLPPGVTLCVYESRESLTNRINDMYRELGVIKNMGFFLRTRADQGPDNVIKFGDRGGSAVVE